MISQFGKRRRRGRRLSAWRVLIDLAMVILLSGLGILGLAGVLSAWVPQMETFANIQGYLAAVAFLVLLVAMIRRASRLSLLAAAIVAMNVATVAYRVLPVESCPVQSAATGQHALRVLSHNIYWDNGDLDSIERMLRRPDPDVIILQEIQPHHLPLFARLADDYPHASICNDVEHCGIVILSRYPLKNRQPVNDRFGEVIALDTIISVEGRELVILGAHLVRPFRGRTQRGQFEQLTAAVAKLPANALVAGDFNSVPWSANMSRYAVGGGVCAANLVEATWPLPFGPLGIPIDNMFLKSGLRLLGIATVDGSGSDHRALLVTVGLH